MNQKNAAIVANALEQNPTLVNMNEGFKSENGDKYNCTQIPRFVMVGDETILIGDCGTTMCIAGMTTLLFSNRIQEMCNWDDVRREARDILELTDSEAYALFEAPLFGTDLGEDLEEHLEDGGTHESYALAAANRVRRFAGLPQKVA